MLLILWNDCNLYDYTVCRVIDYYFDRKMLVSSPLYKTFQPCSGNPTGIPAALHRSGPSFDLGRNRRPRMSLLYLTLSRFATFLYVCYSKIIRSKSPVYKFMPGTYMRVKSSGNTRHKCYSCALRISVIIAKNKLSSEKKIHFEIVIINTVIIDIIKYITCTATWNLYN